MTASSEAVTRDEASDAQPGKGLERIFVGLLAVEIFLSPVCPREQPL